MITFAKPQGGMAVWVKFNKEYNLAEIAGKMAQEGIYINDGSIYNCGNINHNALRMGFASTNMAEMEELIKTLKQFK
jgi:GntR family transcriptional regulator/MocR family aminotransferase